MAMTSTELRLQADLIVASTWRKFHQVVETRVDVLETIAANAFNGELTIKNLQEGRFAAHNLHGELATFGTDRGSEIAAEIELILEGEGQTDCRWERMEQLVRELRREYNLLAARYAIVDMRVH